MRKRGIAITTAAVIAGLVLGALLSPPSAEAVAKEIIELQQQVAILLQNQQSMQNQMTQNFAVLKTLIGQNVDSQNKLSSTMDSLQKTIQSMQANYGSQSNSVSSQVQAVSSSLEDIDAKIDKLSGQMATEQSSLQSLDAKVSALSSGSQTTPPGGPIGTGATPPTGGSQQGAAQQDGSQGAAASQNSSQGGTQGGSQGGPTASNDAPPAGVPAANNTPALTGPPPPADLLYTNALRDFTSGNYNLSNQEFRQYLQYYGQTDLASNAYFYLGEIAYAQGHYPDAINEYNQVLNNYPNSFKRADARLNKAYALLKLKESGPAIAELRLVIRQNPGTEQARKAEAKLHTLGVASR